MHAWDNTGMILDDLPSQAIVIASSFFPGAMSAIAVCSWPFGIFTTHPLSNKIEETNLQVSLSEYFVRSGL
jgi:hypothetical protein